MNTRYAMIAALLGAFSNAMACELLNGWPTAIKTDDGYEFDFKGLYQFDTNQFSGDTVNPATGNEILSDATAWRRKEFNFSGKTPWGVDFSIGYDFTVSGHKTATTGVHGAWIDNFVRFSNRTFGDFRLGQFKTPVGWEEASSSSATTFLERALPVQATNAGRRIGVDWANYGIPNWVFYAAYFNGGDLNGENDGHGPAGRIVWNPINRQPGPGARAESNVIHLGIAASSEDRRSTTDGRGIVTPAQARFRARPEANLISTRLVDTGNLNFPGSIDRIGLEAAWIHGPLLLQGEYLTFSATPAGKPSFNGNGFYTQGSWVLSGESRPYSKGAIGNVRPLHDYGAFEVALRYSQVDLNDAPVPGGKEHDWTLGANWYLGQHLKFQANYIRASSTKYYAKPVYGDAAVDPRVFELRAQACF